MRRITRAFQHFFALEAASGIVLLCSATLALVLANSSLSAITDTVLHAPLVMHIVNDGLMAIFFFVVGLEVKRELVEGELSSFKRAILPALAATGGMIVPALIYAGVARGSPGWGIPTATDIAFVIGVLSLLKGRVTPALSVFAVALAVFDDIGGVALIAIFYGGGVHPAIIGVVVALFMPRRFLAPIVHALHPWQAFVIMPVFALVNAGVDLRTLSSAAALEPVFLGTSLGLFFGKQLGIFCATWLAVRLRIGVMPAGSTWRGVYGIAILSGVGFTVSLFIAQLALADTALVLAKAGVLVGSLVSGVAGYAFIAATARAQTGKMLQ